ncbi:MAG: class I SAM-dependent methyltransferase [gamma proteobacterium symbiont of Bathyaustriella thionipta]|nr:class I SAM-dependent methyltransferase [gamma proteobacterium symbiont of Bathyaustriella thionipta]MCU7950247.1 class I SAM-dependent methyltransferase [gamma proteobacterium symbiont of Bathyaustriella thionipta]MCU7952025.1 class I SAM-dependent methyltransferase [gamma proteobacterium symbiont of Bathyaustriella thionipta]MCU7957590.1 class I SAM-dependent methyltransferase [gamma proteobacterium symbiont of Bathyaustriella thionipta]MCU7965764.1 class I SAM-dependent methyltransferase 
MNNSNNIFTPFGKKKPKYQTKPFVFDDPWLMVRKWYSSELGQALLTTEKHQLNKLLEQIFGYNLIQLGCLDSFELSAKPRTSRQYILESLNNIKPETHVNKISSCTHIITRFDDLAIQNQSIDAVILPHTLEFEQHPHQILREVDRILVAEGKAIFFGFNPYSLWGLWHKYWEVKSRIIVNKVTSKSETQVQDPLVPLPSCGNLISQGRLRDWLKLLGFDIDLVNEYFYRPPVDRSALLKQLKFMEHAGQFSKLLPAGGYMLVATKRVSTLTPLRQRWKFPKSIIGSDTIEPA